MAVAVALAEGTFANTFSATVITFFLLLPFVNALFDWVSWQVSRWLGDKLLEISKDAEASFLQRFARFALDMIIDGGFAVLCLIGLAWAIPRVIETFNGLVQRFSGETVFTIGGYLCATATEPLGDGLWTTSMLFSTLLPTAIHLALLLVAPFLWCLTPGEKSRARAAHLTHGTRPPDVDLRGKGKTGKAAWPSPMPPDYGAQTLREDQAVFQGPLNETTLHAVTMQLYFWRWIYYAFGAAIVMIAIYWLGGYLVSTASGALASSPYTLPQLLLWIAHNFDWSAVHQGCPALDAPPTAPFQQATENASHA